MATVIGPLYEQASQCETILRGLPDWFGIEEAIQHYVSVIDDLPTFVDSDRDGFISVKVHNDYAAEIYVIAVRESRHRQGIGRALIQAAQDWLLESSDVEFLQVKTLGPSRPDANYERTRLFYESMGFRPLEELKTLWNEANPCLLMVKALPHDNGT